MRMGEDLPKKRKRTVYSCQRCRKRKLKCDRCRPKCSFCEAHGYECVYMPCSEVPTKPSVAEQIERLKEKVQRLEKKRDALAAKSEADSNCSSMISFLRCVNRNRYLKALKISMSKCVIPADVEEQMTKESVHVSDTELMKHNLRRKGLKVMDLITSYIRNKEIIYPLVHHFFNTEVCCYFPYINKSFIFDSLKKYYSTTRPLRPTKLEFTFLGTLLMVIRISYISFYNIGFEELASSMTVGPEAVTMANLCLEEVIVPSHTAKFETLKLALMIVTYQKISPELIGPTNSQDRVNVLGVLSIFETHSLQLEPTADNPEAQCIRRMWYSLLEAERTEFTLLGTPLRIKTKRFTTQLPLLSSDFSDDDVINQGYHERFQICPLLCSVSSKVNNFRNPTQIDEYESMLQNIEQHIVPTSEILCLDSSTKMNRWKKALKFDMFLDLCIVHYMLATNMFLYYDEFRPSDPKLLKFLRLSMESTNRIMELAPFLDPQNNPDFDLHKHFGFNIQLIPKLVNCIQRTLQFQFSIYLKLTYSQHAQPTDDYDNILSVKERCLINTTGLSYYWRKLSERYVYANRIYVSSNFILSKIRDVTSKLSIEYIHKVSMLEPNYPLSSDSLKVILSTLKTFQNSESTHFLGDESLMMDFGQLSNYIDGIQFVIDSSVIEQLEVFLNSQEFTA